MSKSEAWQACHALFWMLGYDCRIAVLRLCLANIQLADTNVLENAFLNLSKNLFGYVCIKDLMTA